MLTCLVGKTLINCFDGKYDKYTLKEWSDKNKLICPDCGKPYEYCHGRIVDPYFRHKEKNIECEGFYSEPETHEHINGKISLYNWLLQMQDKGIISSVKLEAYIPETKQRPDIYFEKDGEKYVIEFQCTPIATEYLERHELYQLAKINDIWVMGIANYNITLSESGQYAVHFSRFKTLEKNSKYYFDVENKRLYIKREVIKSKLAYNLVYLSEYIGFSLDDCVISEHMIFINENLLNEYKNRDYELYLQNKDKIDAENKRIAEIQRKRDNILKRTKVLLDQSNIYYEISFREYCPYYNWAIDIELRHKINNQSCVFHYVFFIKQNKIDFCRMNYTYPKYISLDTFECNNITDNYIADFVYKKMLNCNQLIYTEIRCVDCKKKFPFTKGESDFYKSKGFESPKRCPDCRQKKKRL